MASDMIEQKYYTKDFYEEQQSGSYQSALEILGYVNDVFHPLSVADIGCGVGYWLKVWKEKFGIDDIFGLEGPYITSDMLKVPPGNVRFQDLKSDFNINRKFDLVMSMEVAEHLPESFAEHFISSLTQLSDVILFSAAIKGQGGTYHINEQMPEYWAAKFAARGYTPIDFIRPKIWSNEKVEWWYRQNILLYIKNERIVEFPQLQDACKATSPDYLFRVQPWLYFHKLEHIRKTETSLGYVRWKLYPVKKFFQKLFNKK
jgi:hypothetical protein